MQDGRIDFLRASLARAIQKVIVREGLTQAQAGEIAGLKQSDVSNIKRLKLETYSLEKLVQVAARLGIDTEIKIRINKAGAGKISLNHAG